MILDVLDRPAMREPLEKVLSPNGTQEREAGEERLLMSGVSWEQYLQLDKALGDDRPGPRLYFLEGQLEIMTTSLQHEKLRTRFCVLFEDYFFEAAIESFAHGQATMQALREAGAEPDESWCLGREKERPDMVLEIALTSGGLDKLEVYQRFRIPEVWIWRKGAMEIFWLRRDRSGYDGPKRTSKLLKNFDLALLERCAGQQEWRAARLAFRGALRKRQTTTASKRAKR